MDKSALVIDTPNNCSECPCCYVLVNDWGDYISARCQMKYKGFVDEYSEYNKGRPSWCPLRPLPEKLEVHRERKATEFCSSLYGDQLALGYNTCLAEITGETE